MGKLAKTGIVTPAREASARVEPARLVTPGSAQARHEAGLHAAVGFGVNWTVRYDERGEVSAYVMRVTYANVRDPHGMCQADDAGNPYVEIVAARDEKPTDLDVVTATRGSETVTIADTGKATHTYSDARTYSDATRTSVTLWQFPSYTLPIVSCGQVIDVKTYTGGDTCAETARYTTDGPAFSIRTVARGKRRGSAHVEKVVTVRRLADRLGDVLSYATENIWDNWRAPMVRESRVRISGAEARAALAAAALADARVAEATRIETLISKIDAVLPTNIPADRRAAFVARRAELVAERNRLLGVRTDAEVIADELAAELGI